MILRFTYAQMPNQSDIGGKGIAGILSDIRYRHFVDLMTMRIDDRYEPTAPIPSKNLKTKKPATCVLDLLLPPLAPAFRFVVQFVKIATVAEFDEWSQAHVDR